MRLISLYILMLGVFYERVVTLGTESFLRKRLAGSENCCTFASANGEGRFTLVSDRLFHLFRLSFF